MDNWVCRLPGCRVIPPLPIIRLHNHLAALSANRRSDQQPPGTEWLAYSDKCRQQAFRYRNSVYGIQFHPEITPEMIVDWSAQPANCGDVDTLAAPIDPHAAATAPLARHVLEGWLGRF